MKKATIFIEEAVAKKYKYYCEHAEGEVSAMARSRYDKDLNGFIIDDIHLLTQVCTSVATIIGSQQMSDFMLWLDDNNEDISKWNCWLHTHHNFACSWSAGDESCIKSFMNGAPYIVSVVTNKDGDYLGRVDVFPKDSSPLKLPVAAQATERCDVRIFTSAKNIEDNDKKQAALEKKKEKLSEQLKATEVAMKDNKYKFLEDPATSAACKEEVLEKVSKPKPAAVAGAAQGAIDKYYEKWMPKKNNDYVEPDATDQYYDSDAYDPDMARVAKNWCMKILGDEKFNKVIKWTIGELEWVLEYHFDGDTDKQISFYLGREEAEIQELVADYYAFAYID